MATNHYTSPTKSLPTGYDFRSPMLQDLDAIAGLFNLRIQNDFNATPVNAEDIRREWQTPGFSPAFDVRLIFNPQYMLIGYIETWTIGHTPEPWIWGCVHPDYEGRGIGTVLLSWAEARAAAELYMIDPTSRLAPRTVPSATTLQTRALYRNMGWVCVGNSLTDDASSGGAIRIYQEALTTHNGYPIYEKEIRPGESATHLNFDHAALPVAH